MGRELKIKDVHVEGKKMSSRLRQRLFLSIAIIAILFASVIASYAESINYVYDDLNRLNERGLLWK